MDVTRKARNVIFDLGGVVLDWNPQEIVARIQPQVPLQQALRQELFGHHDWHRFDRGTLSEPELIERLAMRLGRSREEWLAILDDIRESLIEKSETVALMRALHQRGVPLYCLSNMPASMYAHLRTRHTFWDVFSGIVISGEIRLMKPEPEVFRHLLETFKLQADETVFVDDMPANVEAAQQLGLHGVLFRDAARCRLELDLLLE